MERMEIRYEINKLKNENRTLNRNITKCENIITKLNNCKNKLDESLGKFNSAQDEIEKNIINDKIADYNCAEKGIKNIEEAKFKISSLIKKIDDKIDDYYRQITSNNNEISSLEYTLANME